MAYENCERTYTVTEVCPHCDSEIEMRWDTDTMGFKAFCPVCGKRLMLCDECRHTDGCGPCDYDSQTDSCHLNPGEIACVDTEQVKRVVIVVEDGTVDSVYAEDDLVDVEIVDKDSDDGDRRGWTEEAVKELREDVASGKLVSVY